MTVGEPALGERVVVITGATGKLGPTVAAAFAEAGDRVAVLARDGAEVEALAASLPGGMDRHLGIAADLLSAEDAFGAARAVRERLGPPTVLLHLAGGYAGGFGISDTSAAQLQDLIDVNLWTTFHAIRAFIADIRAAKDGRIITVSTPLTITPPTGVAAYVATKAAVESMTLSVAKEFADTSSTANVIQVRTIGNAKPSHTSPAEIAAALLWLASPAAGAVNGQRIPLVGRG
jgi:NAD(P)-dependent dehydrogenase (short-subunit alcohol dehydrogenase family)